MSEQFSEDIIISAINKSGYLFENKIANIFEDLGFHIYPNHPFKDPESEKSRELDLMAYRRVHIEGDFYISIRFMVECKNNTNPLVFFRRPKNSIDTLTKRDIYIIGDGCQKELKEFSKKYSFETTTTEDETIYKHTQFCKIIRTGSKIEAQHTGILEGILYPLIKARKTVERKFKNSGIELVIPLVVTNGSIYVMDTSSQVELLKQSKYITFNRKFLASSIEGDHHIDFVAADYLIEYVQQLCIDRINNFREGFEDFLVDKQ